MLYLMVLNVTSRSIRLVSDDAKKDVSLQQKPVHRSMNLMFPPTVASQYVSG